VNRRIVAWIAMLAITLNAMWPVMAHASPRTFTPEICSINPAGALAPSGSYGTDFPDAPGKLSATHCPLCAGWGNAAMAAAAVAWSFILPPLEAPRLPGPAVAPIVKSNVLDSSAHPRAPPLS